MLAKKYRLNRKEIGRIYKKGRRANFGQLGVKWLPNNLEYTRFAVNVPTSVSKKAVFRNRLRRIIYSEVEKMQLPRYDFIISVYKHIDEENIRGKIQEIFTSLHL